MAKERTQNPATAALKASKNKQIKKSKAQLATQRAEKLARRNPYRLQKQIDELKEADKSGSLRPKDKQTLEQLEKDLRAVQKAREVLGDKAPQYRPQREDGGRGSYDGGVLGKRRRDDGGAGERRRREQSSDTDEDAKDIPMPKDVENMPPLPRQQRRPANPNETPLGRGRPDLSLPQKPVTTTPVALESAPVIRDLRKEAVGRFVPASVAKNIKRAKGEGGALLEPEEADRLEQLGYRDAEKAADEAVKEAEFNMMAREVVEGPSRDLDEEQAKLERELRDIEMQGPGEMKMGAYRDAEGAAEEALKEAEFRMMMEEIEGASEQMGKTAERELRRVEIEEVEDEDL